ncbi:MULTISPECIES: phosphoglycolate phosphatase [unclassified Pusillimonas]|uniref:phosphoglycolate phosphatase n=1 Tax=unclassified Pusillimonas TaxID=2640016 RepID=UPI000B9D02B1|nr:MULTISPECIES: phosphoglycolate phosphatase [unclassified Pusillimonas]OXR49653.1 phosphoglycolate phosphatase [Pusillimonas sp. T2]ROT44987.1 phosphoglycolate phosphatase [Pusillimonas sp. NJUB218]
MSKLVLFDFDGTLADTAPDLAAAANRQRERQGLNALPYEMLRPMASAGARGLLKVSLDIDPDHPDYESHRRQFLSDYEQHMTVLTRLFPGVPELLQSLKAQGYRWGIVTNKVEYLALPIVKHLELHTECAVTIGGDTAGYAKPHPAPLLLAAERAGFTPQQCIYIGDDERDIVAGKAAGMPTIAAAYGYCNPAQVANWQADAIAHQVNDLLGHINRLL